MLIDDLCDRLLPAAAGRQVADVRIGLGYTAVLLDNGRCGVAYTFRHETGETCGVIQGAGTLTGSPASALIPMAASTDVIAAAVGVATLNALTEPPPPEEADALDLLAVEPDDAIGMVGHFGPLAGPLRKRAKTLHIFERRPAPGSGFLPEEVAGDVLPQCQVVIVTATSLLNRTMDGLLAHCRNVREVMIVGPSTPLVPDVFAKRGVTLLSGVFVIDSARVLRIVSEAGGTMGMRPAMRKVSLRIR